MKMTIFVKILLLIVALLIPVILLYGYSNQVSERVVNDTIKSENRNRLSFFVSQMDMMVDQLLSHSLNASRDYSIREYVDSSEVDPVVRLQRIGRIVDMLNMQTSTSAWNNQIIFYLQGSQEVISTDYSARYDEAALRARQTGVWEHREETSFGLKEKLFAYVQQSDMEDVMVEVRFSDDSLKNMLSRLKQNDDRESFLYRKGDEPIINYTANFDLIRRTAAQLDEMRLPGSGSVNMELDGKAYIVNYIRSVSLDWHLVDLVPLDSFFAPIHTSRNLFYSSIALLTAMGILAGLLLYRNVQRPLQLLQRGVQRIKEGQYATRLRMRPNNEFDYVFLRFNEMAGQIEELIDKVYKETLRSKEATLKQLQSQINPHFLYNCLFYIKNMAKLKEHEAVEAMALNLGEYYRYTTRLEHAATSLREEVKLVTNYLEIQSMRLQRFHYEIDIPEPMLELPIPKLLLQPLAENAVLHGVERSDAFGLIEIRGEQREGLCRIIVEDNGPGMTEEARAELLRRINEPLEEESGCGLWNIHQRLLHGYGGRSGLQFGVSPRGGMQVVMVWEMQEGREQG